MLVKFRVGSRRRNERGKWRPGCWSVNVWWPTALSGASTVPAKYPRCSTPLTRLLPRSVAAPPPATEAAVTWPTSPYYRAVARQTTSSPPSFEKQNKTKQQRGKIPFCFSSGADHVNSGYLWLSKRPNSVMLLTSLRRSGSRLRNFRHQRPAPLSFTSIPVPVSACLVSWTTVRKRSPSRGTLFFPASK